MKSPNKSRTAQRKQPYAKRLSSPPRMSQSKEKLAHGPTPSPANESTPPTCRSGFETASDVYLEFISKTYPHVTPRDEYDIVMLGTNRREGTAEEIYAWIDREMELDLLEFKSREAVLEVSKQSLRTVVDTTGRKPRPGRDRVDIRAIPNSKYSIRLWPGSQYAGEYCMDFVDTETKQPVNSPFEFELWAVPNPSAPWLCMPSGRLASLERNFGVPQHKILPGEEKWVLRDGQTCLLKRPGQKDVQFTVPARQRKGPANDEVDILDFPKVIEW